MDPFAGVEEMIVTGGGTAALLTPANTSAIAFDAAALEAHGIGDLGDISAQVPNLEIRSSNATNASFFVRGVGLQDFGANASSSVPIFQDGIARNPSATQLVGLFDLGGLSVLKGPQGSGNYRNASAGAIRIQTRMPEPEFSGSAKVTLSRINSVDARDANRYNFEMAMNAPVYGDIVSMRIAARYAHENPFFENGCANRLPIADRIRRDDLPFDIEYKAARICGESFSRQGSAGVGTDTGRTGKSEVLPFLHKYLGEVDDWGLRTSIRIQPPDSNMDWVFRLELSHLNRDSTLGQHFGIARGNLATKDNGGYIDPDIQNIIDEVRPGLVAANNLLPREGSPGAMPPYRLRNRDINRLASAIVGKKLYKRPLDEHPYRGDFDRPGKTILETISASTTGKIEFDNFDLEANFGFLDYRKSQMSDSDLSPNVRFPSFGNDQAYEIYGSLDFSGESLGDLPLEWDTGLYTMHEHVEASNEQTVFDTVTTTAFDQEIYSFGLFTQGSYELIEGLTLDAGVRYNWERKDFKVVESRIEDLPPPIGTFIFSKGSENQRTWDAVTGFVNIRYDFTEEFGTWMRYTRGFKAGHFNPSKSDSAKIPGIGYADPERIDAFEWNFEYQAWANRFNGNVGFFFYNYKNYQVFRLVSSGAGIFRSIETASEARNFGAEFEFSLTPLEGIAPEMFEGLTINIRGGWLETQYIDFTVIESREFDGGRVGVSINYAGNTLISAPNLSFTGTFTWPLVFSRLGTITPQYDFQWSDDVPFDPNNGRGELDSFGQDRLQNYLIGNRAYIIHNARLTWQPPGDSGLKIAGWCRNLEDRRYKTFGVDISTFSSQALIFVADPRMCGGEVSFSF